MEGIGVLRAILTLQPRHHPARFSHVDAGPTSHKTSLSSLESVHGPVCDIHAAAASPEPPTVPEHWVLGEPHPWGPKVLEASARCFIRVNPTKARVLGQGAGCVDSPTSGPFPAEDLVLTEGSGPRRQELRVN